MQQVAEPPDLQVGSLHFRGENDAKAALPQSDPQLDVLDRRVAIARRVESAAGQEDILAHGPAARPESVGIASLAMVVVVVNEILVLRKKVRAGRVLVVAAEHGSGTAASKRGCKHARGVVVNHNVGIDEPKDIAARDRCSGVAGAARPQPTAGVQHPDTALGSDRRRGVGRSIIDDDDFRDFSCATHGEERREARAQHVGAVVHGHDDADRGLRGRVIC